MTAKQISETLNAAVKAKRATAYVSFTVCLQDACCVGASNDFKVWIGNRNVQVEQVGGKFWAFTVFFDETFSFRPYGSLQIPPQMALRLTDSDLPGLCTRLLSEFEKTLKRFPV